MGKFTKLDAAGAALADDAPQWAMVLDNTTNLIWQATNATAKEVTFKGAEKATASMAAAKFGGFSDWRMPTITELLSLVDYTRVRPAIDTSVFIDAESDWYWSSTPYAGSPESCAWIVYFGYGLSGWYYRGSKYFVRAVRSVSPAAASQ